MSIKRLLSVTAAGILIVAAIIAAVVFIRSKSHETAPVTLAPVSASDAPIPEASPDADAKTVQVTAENVQSTVRALERYTTYARTFTVTTCWDGGSSETVIEVYADGENISVIIFGEREKHIIRCNGTVYLWYSGDGKYVSSDVSPELFSNDMLQMLITWEDIVSVPQKDIISASFVTRESENCIYAEYYRGELRHRVECCIGTESGLVMEADEYDGDELIYSMRSSAVNTTPFTADVFDLPDGTSALTAPQE